MTQSTRATKEPLRGATHKHRKLGRRNTKLNPSELPVLRKEFHGHIMVLVKYLCIIVGVKKIRGALEKVDIREAICCSAAVYDKDGIGGYISY